MVAEHRQRRHALIAALAVLLAAGLPSAAGARVTPLRRAVTPLDVALRFQPHLLFDRHEGDWEGVTVVVDAAAKRVEELHFAAHSDVWRYRDGVGRLDGGRHVRVYLAHGSHAAYPRPCRQTPCRQTGSPLPEGRYDGRVPWIANDPAICDRRCVRLLPESGGAPASWDAWDGRWGMSRLSFFPAPRTPALPAALRAPVARVAQLAAQLRGPAGRALSGSSQAALGRVSAPACTVAAMNSAVTHGHLFWITSRAAGTAALLFSSAAVGLGLTMSMKLLRGRGPDLRVVHEALSLGTMVALVIHVVSLLGDSYLSPSVADLTIPFVSGYREPWMSIGIIAGWSVLILGLSYYGRRRIGAKRWRAMHRFTSLAWLAAVAHSFGEGTDVGLLWFVVSIGVVGVPVLGLLLLRLAGGPEPSPPSASARPSGVSSSRVSPEPPVTSHPSVSSPPPTGALWR